MGVGSGAAAAAGVLAVLGGALLLAHEPVAPPTAAPATVAPATAVSTDSVAYDWPTGAPAGVLRPFTAPPERWSAGHRGVDLALPTGGGVRAAGDGVVAFAGRVAGRGVVSIDHADGVRTTYEPVMAAVGRGEQVTVGQVVGTLEPTGHHCPDEPCLHWGARRGRDDYLDPLSLLARDVVIRLLPEHRSLGAATARP